MSQVTIDQALQMALENHRAGRLAEAEGIYRQIIAQQPNQPRAAHLLGVLATQVGRNEVAIELIQQALRLNPNYAEAYCDLGNAYSALGKFDEAILAFRRTIALEPGHCGAYCNLGNVLAAQGNLEEAVAACMRSIELKPGLAQAHNNLGNALRLQGKLIEAMAAYRQAIALKPDYFEAYHNLSSALYDREEFVDALENCRRTLQLNPDFADAYNNLGTILHAQGKSQESVEAYRKAVALRPGYAEAYSNMGTALKAMGKFAEAIAAFERAIELKPEVAEPHWNLALALLLVGDFPRGWAEYEWRWKWRSFPSSVRNFSQPLWNGEKLNGRTLLLYGEQGFGDTIQFVRYAIQIATPGEKVILECQPELYRLLKDFPGVSQVVSTGDPLPPFDLQCPLVSLPLVFGTRIESIPNPVGYLAADRQLTENWRALLGDSRDCLKIGLVWAGRPTHKDDKNRSVSLKQLNPLAVNDRVRFYSLQKGPAAAQIEASEPSLKVIDFAAMLTDFADTAALIANLDLVITVDTAIAHLAGALGKPVWVLLPFVPDWRWLLNRDDSPWYPTMRLFRQKASGQWNEVISQVAESLAEHPAKFITEIS